MESPGLPVAGWFKRRNLPNSDIVTFGGIDMEVPIYRPLADIVEGIAKICYVSVVTPS